MEYHVLRESILEILDRYRIAKVTEDSFQRAFPRVPEIYNHPLMIIALVSEGHRPPTTQEERVERFCKENNIRDHWYDPSEDVYVFEKRIEPERRQGAAMNVLAEAIAKAKGE